MTKSTLYRNAGQHDCRTEWLPWGWCNLRRNPFGELTRDERVSLAVTDVVQWSETLRQAMQHRQRIAIQFIGKAGRGKTTRMLALAAKFPECSYTYVAEEAPCPAIPWGRPILIDEAQRLTHQARQAVTASGAPIVFATHQDLTKVLRASGYDVTTYTIGESNNSSLLCELAQRRIDASRCDDRPVPQFTREDAERMIHRFGTDFRAIEGFLYDQVQSQCYSYGEMRFID
jgi:hypothetical protein